MNSNRPATLSQALALLTKIERSSKQVESLAKEASIDTFYFLATELRLCQTFVMELEQIEESLNHAISHNYFQQFSKDEATKLSNEFKILLDRVISQAHSLDAKTGVVKTLERVTLICTYTKRILEIFF